MAVLSRRVEMNCATNCRDGRLADGNDAFEREGPITMPQLPSHRARMSLPRA